MSAQDANYTDSLATEMLHELKQENKRKGVVNVCMLVLWFLTIVLFVWYLNQYDFSGSSTTTNSAEGVYAIIDSEGNVIASDLDEATLNSLMEGIDSGDGT